jgi:4-amino-4-deoxy-L-arabinose transferase-like glycosyltransferase
MVLIILAISIALRIVRLDQSLWLDEGINVNNAFALDFKSLVLNYSLSDFHPPLYHVVLKLWTMLAGNSEVAVRVPSVVFGVATVYVTYLIAKKLFEEKTALVASTLIATSPLAIYYSQEARMYSLAALAAALSVYFFISLLKKDKLVLWTGFISSTVLMLYSDYLPYFLIPVYIIYLFLNRKKIPPFTQKAFLPAFLIIFFFLGPWLILFPKQAQIGLSAAAASPAWAQVVGSPNLQNLALTFVKFTIGRISHDNNVTYVLFFAPVAAFISFLFAFSLFRLSVQRSFLYYWLFLTIFLAFIVSFFIPVFAYFRFVFVLPAFYIITASAINTLNWTPLVRLLLAAFLAVNIASTLIYFSNPKFQRENWKDATEYVVANSDHRTITLFESNYTVGPFDYYNKDRVVAKGGLDSFNPDPQKVKERVKELTQDKDRVFLFQYLSQITDTQGLIFKELSLLGFVNRSTKDFSGVGFVYEFTR